MSPTLAGSDVMKWPRITSFVTRSNVDSSGGQQLSRRPAPSTDTSSTVPAASAAT
jgi:hypothetical protein